MVFLGDMIRLGGVIWNLCVGCFSLSVWCTSLGGLDPETFQELHFVYIFANCVCVCEHSALFFHAFCVHSTYSALLVSSLFAPSTYRSEFRVGARTESGDLVQIPVFANISVSFHWQLFFRHTQPHLPHPCGISLVCRPLSLTVFSLSTISHLPHFIAQSFPAECNLH